MNLVLREDQHGRDVAHITCCETRPTRQEKQEQSQPSTQNLAAS